MTATRDDAIAAYAAQRAITRRALDAAKLATSEVAALLEAGRDTIAIRTRPAKAADQRVGATRLGGLPDLPAGVTWPQREGYEFDFVGQLRLEELAALDVHDLLPHDGMLSFFAGHDVTPTSEWQLAHRVELYRGALAPDPGDTASRPRHRRPPKARGVELSPLFLLPPPWSTWLPEITHSERYYELCEELYRLSTEPLHPGSGLFGFDRTYEAALSADERMLLRLDAGEQVPYDHSESVTLCFVMRPGHDVTDVRSFEGASI